MEPREPMSGEPRPEDAPPEPPLPDTSPDVSPGLSPNLPPDASPLEAPPPDTAPPEDAAAGSLEWSTPPPADSGPGEIGWRGIGSTLGRALDTYGSAFPVFVALGIPVAIFSAVTVLAGTNLPAVLVASLMTGVVGLVVSAAMIFTADDLGRGIRPSLAGALDRAAGRAVPLLLSTLVVLAVVGGIGALATIVAIALVAIGSGSAGVVALALVAAAVTVVILGAISLRWAVSSPAIVLDDLGPLAGLNRSWSVMRGHLWRLVGLYVVLGLLVIPASSGASLMSTYASQRAVAAVGLGIATLLSAPLLAIAIAIVYRDLAGRPAPAGAGVPRGRGRRTAVVATLGGGLLVFTAGVWAITSSGGQIFVPERGQVLAGTSQNTLDPCHPNGVKSNFDSTEEIWIGAVFTQRVPTGDEVVVEYFGDGTSLGSATLTAVPPGLDCYYEIDPIRGALPATYRVTVTYGSRVIADGSFTVR